MDRILKDKALCKSDNKLEDGLCFENGGEVDRSEAEPVKLEPPHCNPDSLEKQLALKLSFTLPASCYATMAIRELLKTSTSVCT